MSKAEDERAAEEWYDKHGDDLFGNFPDLEIGCFPPVKKAFIAGAEHGRAVERERRISAAIEVLQICTNANWLKINLAEAALRKFRERYPLPAAPEAESK